MLDFNIKNLYNDIFSKVFKNKKQLHVETIKDDIKNNPFLILKTTAENILIPQYIHGYQSIAQFPVVNIIIDSESKYQDAYVNQSEINNKSANLYITKQCLKKSATEYKATIFHELTHIQDFLLMKQKKFDSNFVTKSMKYYSEIHAAEIQAICLFNVGKNNVDSNTIIDIFSHKDITIDKYMYASAALINRSIIFQNDFWENKTEEDIGLVVLSALDNILHFIGKLKVFCSKIKCGFVFDFKFFKKYSDKIYCLYTMYCKLDDAKMDDLKPLNNICEELYNIIKNDVAHSYADFHTKR